MDTIPCDLVQKTGTPDNIRIGLCFYMDHGLNNQNQLDLMLEAVEWADQSGFGFAWVFDGYFHASAEVKLNPAIFHSAISVRTSQIELRGECLAPARRDAIRTVEDWSIIDNLSNGRVGILVPYDMNEPDADRLFMVHTNELQNLWKGDTVKRINGVGNEVDLKIFPRPIQQELPIWVPVMDATCESGFKQVGAFGFNLLTFYENENHEEWLNNIGHYRNAGSISKHSKERNKVTVVVDVYNEGEHQEEQIEESPAESLEEIAAGNYLLKCMRNNRAKISENKFPEFYDKIQKPGFNVNEIAFKVDLTKGRDAAFEHLKRLEKYLA